jgi:predicted Zn-dependent protease
MKLRSYAFYLLVLSLALGCAHGQLRTEPGFNLFSVSQDVQIGQQSAAQVEKQLPLLNEPNSTRLVQRVGARLAAQAPGHDFSYRFKVVNLSDLNAFALPGGYVYVHRGLIERVRTEGELAGVLAHEIAHVALRHGTNQVSRAYVAQAGAGLAGQLLGAGSSSNTARVLNAVGGVGLNTLFLKFSRTAEEEADLLGARTMARAGYDPAEMASFFQFMRQQAGRDPGKVSVFFSSHPSPGDREQRIREAARKYTVRRTAPVGGLRAAQASLGRLRPAPSLRSVG